MWFTAREVLTEQIVGPSPGHQINDAEVVSIIEELNAAGFVIVPKEPNTAMKRALLVHRGYNPDAGEETLDRLGQLDIATMGSFLAAYRAMIAASQEPKP